MVTPIWQRAKKSPATALFPWRNAVTSRDERCSRRQSPASVLVGVVVETELVDVIGGEV